MTRDTIELDLKQIVELILYRKFSIILILLISFVAGFTYSTTIEDSWTGVTKISKIGYQESSKYRGMVVEMRDLNSQAVANGINELMGISFTELSLLEKHLYNLLLEQLNDRSEIVEILDKIEIIKKSEYTESEYLIKLKEQSFTVDIEEITVDNDEKEKYFTISYNTDSIEKIKLIFDYILNAANKNVALFLVEDLENQKNLIKKIIKLQIEDLLNEKIDMVTNFNDRNIERLTFLSEQARIARSLKIENNQLTQSVILEDFKTERQDLRPPYYLRGYLAIEEEIDILKTRDKNSITSISTTELNRKIKALNIFQEKLNQFTALNETPISSDSFVSANFDTNNISFENDKLTLMQILLFCFAFSVLIIFLLLLFSFIYKKN